MKSADLVGIALMGLTMLLIGTVVALGVEDEGLSIVGIIIASIGGLALVIGLIGWAVFAGVSATRRH